MERDRVNHRCTRFMLEWQHNRSPGRICSGPGPPTPSAPFRRGPEGCYSHTRLFIPPVLAWAPKGEKQMQ